MPTPLTATDVRTVEIRLPVATETRLREKAHVAGLPLEIYLEELAESDAKRTGEEDPLAAAIRRLTSRTPAQIEADRERILQASPPPRPLPLGKTLADVVVGTWPGDETDEEIFEMLEKLS